MSNTDIEESTIIPSSESRYTIKTSEESTCAISHVDRDVYGLTAKIDDMVDSLNDWD